MSRIRGTQRIQEDTKGHGEVGGRVLEDTGGAAGIPEDRTLGRFGTVRPGFKSRAPDQFLNSERSRAAIQRASVGHGGSQGDHVAFLQ